VRPCRKLTAAKNRAAGSRPRYSSGTGGTVTQTSSVSRATSWSTLPVSKARVSWAMTACSAGEPGGGGGSRPAEGGRRRRRVARARLSVPVTDPALVSRMPATSRARNPRTSRRMRTARSRGGRSCSAVTNASEMASAGAYRAPGPGARSASPSRRASGQGSSQTSPPSTPSCRSGTPRIQVLTPGGSKTRRPGRSKSPSSRITTPTTAAVDYRRVHFCPAAEQMAGGYDRPRRPGRAPAGRQGNRA